MKNKKDKLKNIFGILVVILSLILVILRVLNNTDYSSVKETDRFYEKHIITFQECASELLDYPNNLIIQKENNVVVRDDWKYYDRKGFVLTITNDIRLSQKQVDELDDLLISKVLKKLRVKKIVKVKDNILFLLDNGISYSVGIAYSPNNVPHNEYVYTWTKLSENWFYFKEN